MKIGFPETGDRIITLVLRDFNELITQLGWNYKGSWVPRLKEEFTDFVELHPPHQALQWLYGELSTRGLYHAWDSTVKTTYNPARPSAVEVAIRFHPNLREEMDSMRIGTYETVICGRDGNVLVKFAYCSREMAQDGREHPAAYASRLITELTGLDVSVDTIAVPSDKLEESADLLIVRMDAGTWQIATHKRS